VLDDSRHRSNRPSLSCAAICVCKPSRIDFRSPPSVSATEKESENEVSRHGAGNGPAETRCCGPMICFSPHFEGFGNDIGGRARSGIELCRPRKADELTGNSMIRHGLYPRWTVIRQDFPWRCRGTVLQITSSETLLPRQFRTADSLECCLLRAGNFRHIVVMVEKRCPPKFLRGQSTCCPDVFSCNHSLQRN